MLFQIYVESILSIVFVLFVLFWIFSCCFFCIYMLTSRFVYVVLSIVEMYCTVRCFCFWNVCCRLGCILDVVVLDFMVVVVSWLLILVLFMFAFDFVWVVVVCCCVYTCFWVFLGVVIDLSFYVLCLVDWFDSIIYVQLNKYAII